jgi:DNA-binding winged helix-turn-helix (wHTH) protein/tetratricopeptide (TPR) repeat protein
MAPAIYKFASFVLDLDRLSLFGPGGQVDLRPKSFDVLRYLVEHAGRIIGKEELIRAIWPQIAVTDESLTRCISEVRQALDDRTQRIIKTVAKRGYLLDVPVSVDTVAAPRGFQPTNAPGNNISSANDLSKGGLVGRSTIGLYGVSRIPMHAVARRSLQFGHFTLNLTRGSLHADGHEIDLRPKTFEVLRHLAENAGRLVPKQELHEVVWPGINVSDDSLMQCVRELRKKLGDDKHRLIKMMPRRGYMLDATLRATTQTTDNEDDIIWKSQTAIFTTGRPSITVLPFSNEGDNPDYMHFVAGVTEDIIAGLSRCNWLSILSADCSHSKNGRSGNRHCTGPEPRANYELRGIVTHAGSRLRIVVQLIDTWSGVHIWADRFDGDIYEIFALQDRITESVVAALEPALERAELHHLRHRSIDDLGPDELVMCARAFEYEFTEESYAAAFRCLNQALEAFCRVFRVRQGWSPSAEEDTHEGYRLATRALELGPHDPRVLTLSSIAVRALGGDVHRGWELAKRAIELNPNSVPALVNAGFAEVYLGNPAKAVKLLRRAGQLNPHDPKAWYGAGALGQAYFAAGKYQESVRWSQKAMAQNPRLVSSKYHLAAGLVKLGRMDEAAQIVALILKQVPNLTLTETHRQHRHMPESIMSRWLDALRVAGLPR